MAMGGYNTFCEILSLDKPALIVPRKTPRLEQSIRADQRRAARPAAPLDADASAGDGRDPAGMARGDPRPAGPAAPSAPSFPGLLDGLDRIGPLPARASAAPPRRCRAAPSAGAPNERTGGYRRRRAASPSSSRAIRACPRPSSPRRSWPWSGPGSPLEIWSLRQPTDKARPPAAPGIRRRCATCRNISTASRCACCAGCAARPPAAAASARSRACSGATCGATRRRTACRRLGQALVLARELPAAVAHLHVHYLHTPGLGGPLRGDADRAAPSASRRTPRTSGRRRTGRSARRSPTASGA